MEDRREDAPNNPVRRGRRDWLRGRIIVNRPKNPESIKIRIENNFFSLSL